MTTDLSLPDLAAKIREAHRRVQDNLLATVDSWLQTGELLTEAKRKVRHGRWEWWVEENCGFGPRQARKYMCLHEKRASVLAQTGIQNADLTIDRMLASLVDPEKIPGSSTAITVHDGSQVIEYKVNSVREDIRVAQAKLLQDPIMRAGVAALATIRAEVDERRKAKRDREPRWIEPINVEPSHGAVERPQVEVEKPRVICPRCHGTGYVESENAR
jgi:Protein of unknown function (DUF3102)